jgi:hypothetical protein
MKLELQHCLSAMQLILVLVYPEIMEKKSKIKKKMTEKTDGRSSPELGMVLAKAISMRKWAAGQGGDPF